jgi:hypothetical protein
MRAGSGELIGVRVRASSGSKWAIRGSRNGLFVPRDLRADERLLLPEGPTDTAAALALGFEAVGRPSCSGGGGHVVELVRRLAPRKVVVVADRGQPGVRGAVRLSRELAAITSDVRIFQPPDGANDLRAWRAAGATTATVAKAIDDAIPVPAPREVPL